MRKAIILLSVFVLGLLTSLFLGIQTVKAQYISTDVEYGSPFTGSTYVNQPVEFIATSSGGTPPYTYQWYTQLWPTWKPGMSYSLAPLGDEIAVPGVTSSKFKFAESTPGTYSITLRVTDSEGQSTYHPFLPGLWVFVLPLPAPSPSPPSISFLSPENNTYAANDIPLNFTISKPAEWIGYSIDGQANITINGNTTLTALPNGAHSLTIYANDTEGNMAASGTVIFSIDVPTQEQGQEPSSTTLVGASASMTVIGIGLVVLFRKRNRK